MLFFQGDQHSSPKKEMRLQSIVSPASPALWSSGFGLNGRALSIYFVVKMQTQKIILMLKNIKWWHQVIKCVWPFSRSIKRQTVVCTPVQRWTTTSLFLANTLLLMVNQVGIFLKTNTNSDQFCSSPNPFSLKMIWNQSFEEVKLFLCSTWNFFGKSSI